MKNKCIALLLVDFFVGYCYNIFVFCIIKTIIKEKEESSMAVSYKKLWKLLIDKDMKKKDLENVANISNYTITKLNKGENVTVEVIGKICKALNCTADDIMEFTED